MGISDKSRFLAISSGKAGSPDPASRAVSPYPGILQGAPNLQTARWGQWAYNVPPNPLPHPV